MTLHTTGIFYDSCPGCPQEQVSGFNEAGKPNTDCGNCPFDTMTPEEEERDLTPLMEGGLTLVGG